MARPLPSRTVRHVSLLVLVALGLSCAKDANAPETATIADLVVVSGGSQEGIAGEELAAPLVVRVVDVRGRPVAGQIVNFRVASGGGSVFAGAALTDRSGIASDRWTLGPTTGEQTLEVRAVSPDGVKQVFGTFKATAKPGAPATLTIVGGNAQTGAAGSVLADSLAVQVADKHGNGVPGVTVTWAVTAGGGAVSPAVAVTGPAGIAKAAWTLGTRAGANSATATAAGLPQATFSAIGAVGAPARLEAVSGTGQRGTVGTTLAQPFVVRISDAAGNLVSGMTVTWTVTEGGGSLSASSVMTDASGLASTTLTLGSAPGTTTVRAEAGTLAPVTFAATAITGTGASLQVASGDNQTGTSQAQLPQPLVVRVVDGFGNGVAGVSVTWAVTEGGGSLSAGGPTDANGYTSARWTLGAPGANAATASAVGARVTFHATATLPQNVTFAKVSGDGQTGVVYTVAPEPLVVRATDASGRPLGGAPVTWQATPGSAWFEDVGARQSGVDGVVLYTDADGYSRVRLRIASLAGTTTVTAKLPGAPTLSFTATGTPDRVCNISIAFDVNLNFVPHWAETTTPIEARSTDYFGNPLPGYQVTIDSASGGGSVSGLGTTDAAGTSKGTWRFGPTVGTQRLYYVAQQCRYDLNTYPQGFTSTSTHVSRAVEVQWLDVSKTSGDAQTGSVGQQLTSPLAVSVIAGGASPALPIAGAHVVWRVASGGGRVTPDTSLTDANGNASGTFTLGPSVGAQTVWAKVAGDSVLFTATATVGGSVSLVKVAGDAQTAPTGNPVAQKLTVRAVLANGAGVPNAMVTWEVTGGNGTASPTTVTTDSLGYASTQWTLGAVGTNTLSARTETARVSFSATATGLPSVVALTAGSLTTCTLATTGNVFCWGRNQVAQFGNGAEDALAHPTPQLAAGGQTFSSVSGAETLCGLVGGSTSCWGSDFVLEAGSQPDARRCPNNYECIRNPTRVEGAPLFASLDASRWPSHSCGLTAAGEAYCWGDNREAALGNGAYGDVRLVTAVNTTLRFSAISVGNEFTCALAQPDGAAYCWGTNVYGQLGTGGVWREPAYCSTSSRGRDGERCSTVPVPVAGGLKFAKISAGMLTTCGVTTSGALYCWGDNQSGVLGIGGSYPTDGTYNAYSPVQVAPGTTFSDVAVGNSHACALTTSGDAMCWGANSDGRLGIGAFDGNVHRTPEPVTGGLRFTTIRVGLEHSCALTAANVPYCWGANRAGQIGDGTTVDRPAPTRVQGY